MNLPNIDLNFKPFCNGCRSLDLKVIDSDRFYSDNGKEIYIYPPTITCEHIHTCLALYERICKKEENADDR